MKINDRLNFRKMQIAFFAGMQEYPNDKERMEKALQILENYIDNLIERECSKVISASGAISLTHNLKTGGKA
jgi:hypothetical protein